MRIINKKYLLIIILVGVILTGVIILKPAKEVKLDNVILKQEVNNKTFAMYKEDDDNNYVKVEDTKFPDMYVLNLTKSKCIDNNGNELNGVLSYENDKVTITSGNTTYCYLYFDKSIGLEIKEKNPNKLSEEIKGAMYRFQGQQSDGINNYICFGTSDKDTCLKDTDHYMYRIIGIEAETGRVKVIKKEALDKAYQWWDDYITDIEWPNSLIFKAINEKDFLKNVVYIPADWEEKISTNSWIYGDMLDNSDSGAKQIANGLYEIESGQKATHWYVRTTAEDGGTEYEVKWNGNVHYTQGTKLYYNEESGNWTKKIDSKVSLMYLSDYSYSVGDQAKCNYFYGDIEYSKCKTGWMHLSQNDINSPPSVYEWTVSRYGWGLYDGAFLGFYVDGEGFTRYAWLLTSSLSVRPVFYIDASQILKDGTGTITNPFIIK